MIINLGEGELVGLLKLEMGLPPVTVPCLGLHLISHPKISNKIKGHTSCAHNYRLRRLAQGADEEGGSHRGRAG